LMLRLQLKQLQGHPEFIVEVSLRFENREARTQNFRDRLFCRGLARAAGYSDDALVPMAAYRGGQDLQRLQRIIHDQETVAMGQVEKIRHLAAGDDGSAGTAFKRGSDEAMSVVTLPANGEKQIPRPERARVDGIS